MKRITLSLFACLFILICSAYFWINKAPQSHHESRSSSLGTVSELSQMVESMTSGQKVSMHTLESADWQVPLSGLINLDHPLSKQARLKAQDKPIKIYAYHIRHPQYGDFLVDTGVSHMVTQQPDKIGIPTWLSHAMGLEKLSIISSTEAFLSDLAKPLQGVFLSHLHFDHISGLPAIDKNTPIYVGRGEANEVYWSYAFTNTLVDVMLTGRPTLQTWPGKIVDIFSDGSVFAIHVPGHTAGSTAFLVNDSAHTYLLTGDVSHTRWGWENGVEPGKFSSNQIKSRSSLLFLKSLLDANPAIKVKLGHQTF